MVVASAMAIDGGGNCDGDDGFDCLGFGRIEELGFQPYLLFRIFLPKLLSLKRRINVFS